MATQLIKNNCQNMEQLQNTSDKIKKRPHKITESYINNGNILYIKDY